jgi:hypothetical protein
MVTRKGNPVVDTQNIKTKESKLAITKGDQITNEDSMRGRQGS